MSTTDESDYEAQRARARRRRNKRMRQTILFGSICGAMILALIFSFAIYNGSISGPFDFAFTSDKEGEEAPTPPPCPGPDDTPVPYSDVVINVFNTTDVSGLAGSAADAFVERGFELGEVSNEEASVHASAELRFGPQAIAEAYTLEAQLEGAVLRLDENRTDSVVDVLIGDAYDELQPVELVDLVPDEPFRPLSGCVPVTVPEVSDDPGVTDDTEVPPQDGSDESAPDDEDSDE